MLFDASWLLEETQNKSSEEESEHTMAEFYLARSTTADASFFVGKSQLQST